MQARLSIWRDYYELCKPRVVMLMLLTSYVGMQLASEHHTPWRILVFASVGIALSGGAAAVINHLVDRHIDIKMRRTHHRPVATGRVSPQNALVFAGVLTLIGMTVLVTWINFLTAVLTFATVIGYAVVYTLFLKHATPQNIVIGGLAGAAPPLLGWTAVTGQIDPQALLLVLIIFVWTPPHFWALAIHRKEEYAKADVPMLPVTHGERFTKNCIVLYTILLNAVTLMPYAIGMSGWFYAIGSIVLGLVFLGYTLQLRYKPQVNTAINTFKYSIYYLMLLFILLLFDHFYF